jgi:Protein of unknown function (DUF3800)
VIYFYCDESGNAGRSDWVAVCGYRLSHYGIHPFSAQWVAFLDAHNIPPIHMRKIFGNPSQAGKSDRWAEVRKQMGNRWEEFRDRELDCFAALIQKMDSWPITAMGTVIDAKHFRTSCRKLSKKVDGNVIRFALQHTILKWMEKKIAQAEDPEVGIVLDDNHNESLRFHKWVNEIKYGREQATGRHIKSICFVDDIGYPLVQAADMLVYAARDKQQCLADGKKSKLLPSLYEQLTNNLVSEPEVLDAQKLDTLEAKEK